MKRFLSSWMEISSIDLVKHLIKNYSSFGWCGYNENKSTQNSFTRFWYFDIFCRIASNKLSRATRRERQLIDNAFIHSKCVGPNISEDFTVQWHKMMLYKRQRSQLYSWTRHNLTDNFSYDSDPVVQLRLKGMAIIHNTGQFKFDVNMGSNSKFL